MTAVAMGTMWPRWNSPEKDNQASSHVGIYMTSHGVVTWLAPAHARARGGTHKVARRAVQGVKGGDYVAAGCVQTAEHSGRSGGDRQATRICGSSNNPRSHAPPHKAHTQRHGHPSGTPQQFSVTIRYMHAQTHTREKR